MNDVGPAALGRQRRRAPFQRRVRRRLVLALGERVQGCAQHPVEQQVAGGAVERAHAVHPVLELDVDGHTEFACSGGGDAHQVRLHRAGDQHRIRAARLRLAEVELELAHLVAAEGEAGAVVPLDPEIDAERRAEVRGGIDRRRRMAEPRPREAGDAGKGAEHDGNRPVRWLLRGSVSRCGGRGAVQCRRLQANSAGKPRFRSPETLRLQPGPRPACRPGSALSVAEPVVPSPFDTVPPEWVATTKQVLPAPGPHAPPHPDPGAIPHAAAAPHRSCGSSRASACSRVRSSGGTSFEGHPLLEGTPAPGDLTAWPWIDFDPPALDRLLERLFRDTGRRAATVLRAGAAGRCRDVDRALARLAAARLPRPAGRAAAQAAAARLRPAPLTHRLRHPARRRGPRAVPPARTDAARQRDRPACAAGRVAPERFSSCIGSGALEPPPFSARRGTVWVSDKTQTRVYPRRSLPGLVESETMKVSTVGTTSAPLSRLPSMTVDHHRQGAEPSSPPRNRTIPICTCAGETGSSSLRSSIELSRGLNDMISSSNSPTTARRPRCASTR